LYKNEQQQVEPFNVVKKSCQ